MTARMWVGMACAEAIFCIYQWNTGHHWEIGAWFTFAATLMALTAKDEHERP